jgi:hypothetical protein
MEGRAVYRTQSRNFSGATECAALETPATGRMPHWRPLHVRRHESGLVTLLYALLPGLASRRAHRPLAIAHASCPFDIPDRNAVRPGSGSAAGEPPAQ